MNSARQQREATRGSGQASGGKKSTREAMLDLQESYLELGRILAKEIRAFYVRVGLLSDNDGGPRDSGAGGS